MIKKILIDILHTIIAALVGLAGFTVFSIFIAAVVNDAEDPMAQNMILAIVCTIAFIIGLLYVRKIRNETGENEVSKDYKNEGYQSIKDDFLKVLKSEKWVLIAICVISLICYGANVYCYGVLLVYRKRLYDKNFPMND